MTALPISMIWINFFLLFTFWMDFHRILISPQFSCLFYENIILIFWLNGISLKRDTILWYRCFLEIEIQFSIFRCNDFFQIPFNIFSSPRSNIKISTRKQGGVLRTYSPDQLIHCSINKKPRNIKFLTGHWFFHSGPFLPFRLFIQTSKSPLIPSVGNIKLTKDSKISFKPVLGVYWKKERWFTNAFKTSSQSSEMR